MSDLFIKNPHSILAALENRPKEVLEIVLPRDPEDGVWGTIVDAAQKYKVRTRESGGGGDFKRSKEFKNDRGGAEAGRVSGHGAMIRPKAPSAVERLFDYVKPETRGVWLALDSLQDPQNLGAIFRSAAFFGVKGIIMTSERSAPMTSTVYDIAAGGVESVPYVPIINLQRAFEKAKDAGLWILGTSEHAKTTLAQVQKDRAWLIVMGNEEKGIRRLTEESCDMMCTIRPKGNVTSLNVSVATGVLLANLT